MKESHVESANFAIFLAAIIAITLACGLVLAIYGYMDHTQNNLSVRVGNHDLKCLHQQCSETEAW
jgi:ribulose-5-phosphate 4-epimerase/fuculose-1-phosphate aldolase